VLPEKDLEFRELVVAAMRNCGGNGKDVETFVEAFRLLREEAEKSEKPTSRESVKTELRALTRLLAPQELLVVEPAVISQRHGVATAARRAFFNMPFHSLRRLLNPENWLEMGPFFEEVRSVKEESTQRQDGWHGLFEELFVEELFVIDWGPFRMQSFNTFLKIDHTFTEDRARTDYSLVYEKDNQLEEDRGYLEARRIPGRLGWCEYYAEKATRLQSPLSNMLAPMLNAVFLESGLSAIEDTAIDSYYL
jgi:hypothetical protein